MATWDEAKAELAKREAAEKEHGSLVETYKGVEIRFQGISYRAPAVREYGYASIANLKRAISRVLAERAEDEGERRGFDWKEHNDNDKDRW